MRRGLRISAGLAGLAAGVVILAAVRADLPAAEVGGSPVIKHSPVKVAVRGQPLFVRATVTDATGTVAAVTLLYATSRDAAPFKVAMQDAGAGSYVGSIPAGVLSGIGELSYYIEATDSQGATSETPWYAVRLSSDSEPAAAGDAGATGEGGPSWVKPALYAGGAAALVGGAALLLSDSGNGGSGGGGNGSATNSGEYSGSVTTCLEWSGESPDCSSHSMTIVVTADGRVSSDTLHEGEQLVSSLAGSSFTLVGTVDETNTTGVIHYNGTLVGDRIAGSINGAARSSTGAQGSYSGTFHGVKR